MRISLEIFLALATSIHFCRINIASPFKGTVKSHGYMVQVVPGAAAITPINPQQMIIPGGKVDSQVTPGKFLIPPYADNVIALVQSLHSKLDVKGEYTKFQPKKVIIKTKPKTTPLKIIEVHQPKMVPLRGLAFGHKHIPHLNHTVPKIKTHTLIGNPKLIADYRAFEKTPQIRHVTPIRLKRHFDAVSANRETRHLRRFSSDRSRRSILNSYFPHHPPHYISYSTRRVPRNIDAILKKRVDGIEFLRKPAIPLPGNFIRKKKVKRSITGRIRSISNSYFLHHSQDDISISSRRDLRNGDSVSKKPAERTAFLRKPAASIPGNFIGKKKARRSVLGSDDLKDKIADMISNSLQKRKKARDQINLENDNNDDDERIEEGTKHAKEAKKEEHILGSPEVSRYVDGMKSKVNNVVTEAKEVLKDTGRVVHGLKKVISGAKKLTDFADNAVKFAKYFAMEPNNATVDFFEEKAVIAVLESQKAAAEAKIAAVIAKEAAKKAQSVAKRIDKEKRKKLGGKLTKALKYVEGQALRAEESAKMTSLKEKKAKNDAIVVDKALRKMVEMANSEEKGDKDEKAGEGSESDEETRKEEEVKIHKEENKGTEMKIKLKNPKQNATELPAEKEARKPESKAQEITERHETKIEENKEKEDSQVAAEDDIKGIYESVKTTIKNAEKNKTAGLEASDLPELFEGGDDQNEVVSNDFEEAGETISNAEQGAKNDSTAKEMSDALDKIAEEKSSKSIPDTQPAVKGSSSPNATASRESTPNRSKLGRVKIGDWEAKTIKTIHKPAANIVEEKVEKVNKGPLSLVVTVTRRKLSKPNKTVADLKKKGKESASNLQKGEDSVTNAKTGEDSISNAKKKEKEIDPSVYDPFNFQSIAAPATSNTEEQSHIVDKEDSRRIGLIRDSNENVLRSTVPKRRQYIQKPSKQKTRSRVPNTGPKFFILPNQNYANTKINQRSVIPVAPRRYQRIYEDGVDEMPMLEYASW